MDEITVAADTPPDWDARASELLCPLCKYNLRGLSVPRCPECGFAFRWGELIEAEKNKHAYLFEHAKGIGFKSFWKTYWRTSWPRRFWSDLNPAQPVRVGRMVCYWVIATAVLVGIAAGLNSRVITAAVQTAIHDALVSSRARATMKARALAISQAAAFFKAHPDVLEQELDKYCPSPWKLKFWKREVGGWSRYGFPYRFSFYSRLNYASPLYWCGVFIAWPWITLMSLVVFRVSMRQARIRSVHLLRAVIYCCDSGGFVWGRLPGGWPDR